ncbi:MAG: hypothetical protein M3Q29_10920 [Chloroflexota bacterium]|nr:hypothetical protein [Chloroflexota bacterium]
MLAHPPLQLAKRWLAKAGFSLLDQGALSGGNFVLNVLLALWLPYAEYGAFATAFSFFLFVSSFHNALVLEPLSSLGPAQGDRSIPGYLSGVTRFHILLTIGLGALTAMGGLLVEGSLRSSLWAIAAMLPVMLLLWLVRREFYLNTSPETAAAATCIYTAALLLGVLGLRSGGRLSPATAYLFMGLASAVACAAVWNRLRRTRNATGGAAPTGHGSDVATVVRDHWRYGRWLAGGALLSLASTHAPVLLAARMLGLEAAGVLRAMQVFMLPMVQVILALGLLGLPVLSRQHAEGDTSRMRASGMALTAGLTLFAVLYEVVLFLGADTLQRILFGQKYADAAWLIPIFGLVPVFTAIVTGYSLMLRAVQRPEYYLIAHGVAAPVALLASLALIRSWGLGGAAASVVIANAAFALVVYVLYRLRVSIGGGYQGMRAISRRFRSSPG